MLARDHLDQIARTIQKLIFIGGRLTNVPPAQPVEFSVGHDPEPRRHRPRGGAHDNHVRPGNRQSSGRLRGCDRALGSVDQASTPLTGELLRVRLIGDAGALIMLTDPDLFKVRRAAVRIGLHGAEPGRTLIDPAAPLIDVIRCECGSGRAAICRCHP